MYDLAIPLLGVCVCVCVCTQRKEKHKWMDLEGIMLSEIRQRQIPYDITYMWNLKMTAN